MDTPADYIAAWKHLAAQVKASGIENPVIVSVTHFDQPRPPKLKRRKRFRR